jgi:hypothetical protein
MQVNVSVCVCGVVSPAFFECVMQLLSEGVSSSSYCIS